MKKTSGKKTKVPSIEEVLAMAKQRQHNQCVAACRIQDATANMSDYQMILGEYATCVRNQLLPVLTLVRALREHHVARAVPADPYLDVAREVLSYPPGAALPRELEARAMQLKAAALDPKLGQQERCAAAVAALVLWRSDGRSYQRELWLSGAVEQAAAEVWCDYERWDIAELVADWSPWVDEAKRSVREQLVTPPDDLDETKLMVSFHTMVLVVKRGLLNATA
jgi:hypothetical protein